MPEKMNLDDYCFDDNNFDGNDDHLEAAKRRIANYREASKAVVASWEKGDLAAAVRALAAVIDEETDLPADFYEEKAERIGFRLKQTDKGPRWVWDENECYETAKEAVESMS